LLQMAARPSACLLMASSWSPVAASALSRAFWLAASMSLRKSSVMHVARDAGSCSFGNSGAGVQPELAGQSGDEVGGVVDSARDQLAHAQRAHLASGPEQPVASPPLGGAAQQAG